MCILGGQENESSYVIRRRTSFAPLLNDVVDILFVSNMDNYIHKALIKSWQPDMDKLTI